MSAHLTGGDREGQMQPFSRLMDGLATGSMEGEGAAPAVVGVRSNILLDKYRQRRPLPKVLRQVWRLLHAGDADRPCAVCSSVCILAGESTPRPW